MFIRHIRSRSWIKLASPKDIQRENYYEANAGSWSFAAELDQQSKWKGTLCSQLGREGGHVAEPVRCRRGPWVWQRTMWSNNVRFDWMHTRDYCFLIFITVYVRSSLWDFCDSVRPAQIWPSAHLQLFRSQIRSRVVIACALNLSTLQLAHKMMRSNVRAVILANKWIFALALRSLPSCEIGLDMRRVQRMMITLRVLRPYTE